MTLLELLKELEQAIPLARELAEVETRLSPAKQQLEDLDRQRKAMVVETQECEARCAKRVTAAEAAMTKHLASLEAEMAERRAQQEAAFGDWKRGMDATVAREAAMAETRATELASLVQRIAAATQEYAAIEARLHAAKQAMKDALSAAGV